MRLCLIARGLTVISIALMIGYAYQVGVWGPYWPVWPIEWRTVGELGFMVCAFAALGSAFIAAHCPEWQATDPDRLLSHRVPDPHIPPPSRI